MSAEEVPVLIVGGSLVGLTLAALLAKHGVRPLAVERHAGTAIHPRAGHFQIRTIEILRELGLEAEARRRASETYDPEGGIIAVESLAGKEIARFVPNLNVGVDDRSPTGRLFIDQDVVEPMLRRQAEANGAILRYRQEMTAFEQDSNRVRAVVRDLDTGDDSEVSAQFMVAADGNRSSVRQRLGIPMRGYGLLSKSVTIYFEADCAPLLKGRDSGVFYVHNATLRGFFRLNRAGRKGFLAINTIGEDVTRDDAVNVSANMTEARALALLRAAIGAPDLPMKIRQIIPWDAEANVASRFRQGRVFLAGDAAHVVPPNGGFGGNTGVQDAHNLAWKLAMVLEGQAGPELLESYDDERRPIGEFTVDQAYGRYATRVVPERGTENLKPIVDDLIIEIGYRYRSSAVIGDGSAGDTLFAHPDELHGAPGTRAPHVALRRADALISTLDLFGANFVLLTQAGPGAWARAAESAAKTLGMPIDVWPIGGEQGLEDMDGRFEEAYGLAPGSAVLVRPDSFVAWRANGSDPASAATLVRVLSSILARSSARQDARAGASAQEPSAT